MRKKDELDDDAENLNKEMDDLTLEDDSSQNNEEDQKKEDEEEKDQRTTLRQRNKLPKEWRYAHGHPKDLIIDDPSQEIRTHSSLRNMCDHLIFISQVEPKSIEKAKNDFNWINAM